MKKASAIFLVLFYAAVNMGMLVSYHFCWGELKGVSLLSSPKACCEDCPGCHDTTYQLSVQSDYYNPQIAATSIHHTIVGLVLHSQDWLDRLQFIGVSSKPNQDLLIRCRWNPVYLMIRAFRI